MEGYVGELLELMDKVEIAPEGYDRIELYKRDEVSDFGRMLIEKRVRPLLSLKILLQTALEEKYIIGYSKTRYVMDYGEGEPEEVKEYGPGILQDAVEGEQVFNHMVSRLGFPALIAEKIPTDNQPQQSKAGTITPEQPGTGWYENKEDETYIMTGKCRLVFTPKAVFVTNGDDALKKDVMDIIGSLTSTFDEFFKENQDKTIIPHEIYIGWLMKWFPGKIKVRSLT